MKNYACIKNDEVVNIVVFDNFNEELLSTLINEFNLDQVILINDEDFFANKVVIGGTYDGLKFWIPSPYPSWVKNEEKNEWQAPITMPEDLPHKYIWNEDTTSWILAPIPEKPFNSWIFNDEYYVWEAPIAYPDNEMIYQWNEDILNWEEIQVSE